MPADHPFGILNFGLCYLFVICELLFDIFFGSGSFGLGLYKLVLTTYCKKLKVSGVGCQVPAIKKSQIPKHKYQTVRQAHHHPEPGRRANHNDRNSKFQTDNPLAFVPNIIITGRQKFGQRYDTTALNVLVIGY
jgi:hypothetical protein